jgi:putative ABC transport system permease protein
MLSDLRFRLRALFRRDAMERELDDELRFHIERETDKYVQAGMPLDEARRKARIAFGGMTSIKEQTREARGIAVIDAIGQDLRYALRGLRMKPAFTAAIVLTLGLGIGANAAMFGIVDRLMFRAPAYLATPDRVHRVYTRYLWDGKERLENGFSYARYLDFVRSTTAFDRAEAAGSRMLAIGTRDDAREMNVGTVSAGFFQLFDAPPALGRYFTADEDRAPLGAPVVVLGYWYWQLHFSGRNVLGTSLRIGDGLYTIIGVAPEGFVGITDDNPPALYIPITAFGGSGRKTFALDYGWTWMDMIVRRKPGVSIEAANADLSVAFARSWDLERERGLGATPNYPTASTVRTRAEAAPLLLARGPDPDQNSHVATWVMGVALIVLLIACANVTNLLLAHGVKRRREIALRLALGVTRRRLLQQLLTESLLLAFLGGVAGLIVAQWGGGAVRKLFLSAADASAVVKDGRTLLFVATMTLAVALLTGLAPALHALRGDVADALKAGSREGSYRRSRIRSGLLLFQGAFSVVLLVGAGLFVKSLSHVRAMRLGYDVTPIAYVEGVRRGARATDAEMRALAERLVVAASAIPGVESASLTISVPFWSNEGRGAPFVPGVDSLRKLGRFALQAGSPSYFKTVGTRIVRGRGFTDDDRGNSAPVVVINEAMADAIWPGKNPLGQIMRIGSDTTPFKTVVGVAETMRGQEITGKPEFWYYLPIEQYMAQFGAEYPQLFVRVSDRGEDHVDDIRKALQAEMPGESYVKVVSLRSLVAPRQRSWEFGAKMFVAFGGLALIVAAIGLYSVVAYSVAQRTHEIGIRIALGAGLSDVMRMIVLQGVAFAVAGIAIGSMIAFWAGHWVEPLLFSQKAFDPIIYVSVATVLLVVAVVATLQPALRATRVDPTVALRSD